MEQPHSIALLVPEIKELLAQRDFLLLKDLIKECNPLDFADSWKSFDEGERVQLFRLLPARSALKLFEILDIEDQRFLLERLGDENVAPILEGMDSPDLAKIFHKLPPRALKKMKSLVKLEEALARVDYLMNFPENSAGSLMHPEFLRLAPRLTAKQALQRVVAVARPNQKEHLYNLFITDEDGKAVGALTLQELISAPEDERLSELMTSVEGTKVLPTTDQEEAAKIFSKYQVSAAPVVDEGGRLLGILTMKDIISVVKQEATEDIAKMAGTQAADIEERSVLRIFRHRMPWLVVTLLGGMLISLVIRFFQPVLAQVIALASFSPLIAGMGGNVGSQSATITVRAIALGKFDRGRKLRTIGREMAVGSLLGVFYAAVLGIVAYAIYGVQYGAHFAVVVSTAMCAAMTVAATMGAVGPMLFDRAGIDPATATGPLVTTTTDIVSNFIYFSLATLLLLRG